MKRNIIYIILILTVSYKISLGYELSQIKIFGDRISPDTDSYSSNIEIVDRAKIDSLKPNNMIDLLDSISTVQIKSYDSKYTTLNLGGFVGDKADLNNVVMINGRRISSPDMSGVDWTSIPVSSVERIEIYRGSNSVLFGDRAVGGIINIITKKPLKNSFLFSSDFGSYNMSNHYAEGSYVGSNYSFILNGNMYNTNGYRENSDLTNKNVNFEASYIYNKGEITVSGYHNNSSYGLPGALSKFDIDTYGKTYSKNKNDKGDDHTSNISFNLQYNPSIGKFVIDGSYTDRHRDFDYISSYWSQQDNLKSYTFYPQYIFSLKKGAYENQLISGLDYNKYDVNITSSESRMKRETYGVYLYDRASLDSFGIEFGFRKEYLDDDYTTYSLSKSKNVTAYNALMSYKINKLNSIYLKYDRSFRFPTTDELLEYGGIINSDIETQISKTFETGYKYNNNNKYYANLSVYKQLSNNEIFSNPAWKYGEYANLNFDTDKTVLNIQCGTQDKIYSLDISYSYIDSTIEEDGYKGKKAPLVSDHSVKITTGYKFGYGLSAYYYLKLYSSYYQGNDYKNNAEKVDGYAVSDVKVNYSYGNFDIYMKINNLFNKSYYSNAFYSTWSGSNYYPSPERNWQAGASYKF